MKNNNLLKIEIRYFILKNHALILRKKKFILEIIRQNTINYNLRDNPLKNEEELIIPRYKGIDSGREI